MVNIKVIVAGPLSSKKTNFIVVEAKNNILQVNLDKAWVKSIMRLRHPLNDGNLATGRATIVWCVGNCDCFTQSPFLLLLYVLLIDTNVIERSLVIRYDDIVKIPIARFFFSLLS